MAVDSRLDKTSNQPGKFRAFFNRRYIVDAVPRIPQLAPETKQHTVVAESISTSMAGTI
jgi:hypothetical protein